MEFYFRCVPREITRVPSSRMFRFAFCTASETICPHPIALQHQSHTTPSNKPRLGCYPFHNMQPFVTYYCYGVLALLLAVIASSNIKSVGVEAFGPIYPRCYSPPKTTGTIIMMRLRSSGRSPSRIASHTVTQQWDRHLDLARNAHRKRHFHLVRELCSRVISIAEDWSAVEQAHLRLALAEQKAKRVEAARRAFQVQQIIQTSDALYTILE